MSTCIPPLTRAARSAANSSRGDLRFGGAAAGCGYVVAVARRRFLCSISVVRIQDGRLLKAARPRAFAPNGDARKNGARDGTAWEAFRHARVIAILRSPRHAST